MIAPRLHIHVGSDLTLNVPSSFDHRHTLLVDGLQFLERYGIVLSTGENGAQMLDEQPQITSEFDFLSSVAIDVTLSRMSEEEKVGGLIGDTYRSPGTGSKAPCASQLASPSSSAIRPWNWGCWRGDLVRKGRGAAPRSAAS